MMMNRIPNHRALAVLGLAALVAVGCASTQTAGTQLGDAAIAGKVEAKLAADPEINPFEIDVDANEGVVTLSGAVDTEHARAEAERLARATDGVRDVINDVKIGDRGFGERVEDGWITTKIKSKLTADPALNPFNINVDTKDGIVTLAGRVKSAAAKAEAEELAGATEGVREVVNRLEVGDETPSR